jgi:hypothetical protein
MLLTIKPARVKVRNNQAARGKSENKRKKYRSAEGTIADRISCVSEGMATIAYQLLTMAMPFRATISRL